MSAGIPIEAIDRPPSQSLRLRDGTPVAVHAIRAGDAEALTRFHATLSPHTTYLRYFSVHPHLSSSEVERFTQVDHEDREALVATIDREIVAVARFDRLAGGADAEVAFVVADGWQGRGLGTALFRLLATRARHLGVDAFVADTLPTNHRMLKLFHSAGLPITSHFADGVVQLRMVLGPDEPET